MDEACSRKRLGFSSDRHNYEKKKAVEAELTTLNDDLEKALMAGNIEAAAEVSARQKELAKKNARKQSSSQRNITVQENDIADVVSVWTKIPVSKLTEKESKKLERLESELHKRVVGQEEAVQPYHVLSREAESDLRIRRDRWDHFCSSDLQVSVRQSFPRLLQI